MLAGTESNSACFYAAKAAKATRLAAGKRCIVSPQVWLAQDTGATRGLSLRGLSMKSNLSGKADSTPLPQLGCCDVTDEHLAERACTRNTLHAR